MKDRLYSALFRISNDPPGDGTVNFPLFARHLQPLDCADQWRIYGKRSCNIWKTTPTWKPLPRFHGNFTVVPWPTYIENIARDGTYGDHLTLQVTADILNVDFFVISSLGPAATTIISPTD